MKRALRGRARRLRVLTGRPRPSPGSQPGTHRSASPFSCPPFGCRVSGKSMILSLAGQLGLLAQVAALATTPAPTAAPVRVWRADSTVYVALREPGHVLLLHVDAIGRIRVLFPATPDDTTAVSADAPLAVPLPPVAEGNPATFVAVRTRWPFDLGALRSGSDWDYANAWLLQPTAGDPLAALLDVADRVTAGRPYDHGQATYSRGGTLVARGRAVQPDVCFSCYRHATAALAPTAV